MGKKNKNKKKSTIDWDALVRASPDRSAPDHTAAAAGGGGWSTGPASMALDDLGLDDYGYKGPEAPSLEGVGGQDAAMGGGEGGGGGSGKKKGNKGRGRFGGARGGGAKGGDAMDTTDAGARLGIAKSGGMKVSGKRGNRTAMQLKRKMAKQEKALAFSERLEARAGSKMSKKARKASLKSLY